jgi:hypothetical protein
VKELRKNGLTDEEYVKWSQADPKVRKNRISNTSADVFCRQLFRNYSDSPSGSVLAKSPAEKSVPATDFGKTIPLMPGWYQVTKILFRGHLIADEKDAEKISVVYWRIPKEGDKDDLQWGDIGIAHDGNYDTDLQNRRDDGLYPLRLGMNGDSLLPTLASFHDNSNMVLAISLNPNEEPKNMMSEPDSNCVRVEMKKVADLPIPEPLNSETITNQTSATRINNIIAQENDNNISIWFNVIRYAAIITACIALFLALIISVVKKRYKNSMSQIKTLQDGDDIETHHTD